MGRPPSASARELTTDGIRGVVELLLAVLLITNHATPWQLTLGYVLHSAAPLPLLLLAKPTGTSAIAVAMFLSSFGLAILNTRSV